MDDLTRKQLKKSRDLASMGWSELDVANALNINVIALRKMRQAENKRFAAWERMMRDQAINVDDSGYLYIPVESAMHILKEVLADPEA